MNTEELYKEKSNEELLQLYKEMGSLEIKQEIVMRYIYLVKSIALQMRDIYMSFVQVDDVINEGVIAIMSAIDMPERPADSHSKQNTNPCRAGCQPP